MCDGQFYGYLKYDFGASILYHKFLALPLLPAESILEMFQKLKLDVSALDSSEIFQPFIDYFEQKWMNPVSRLVLYTESF